VVSRFNSFNNVAMPEENKVMKPSCLNNMFNCDVSSKLCAFLYQRGGASLIVAKVLARSRRSLGSRKGYRFEAAQKARRRFFTSKKVFFHCWKVPLSNFSTEEKFLFNCQYHLFYRFTFLASIFSQCT